MSSINKENISPSFFGGRDLFSAWLNYCALWLTNLLILAMCNACRNDVYLNTHRNIIVVRNLSFSIINCIFTGTAPMNVQFHKEKIFI